MSDGESTAPTPRQRPSYGLPGPTAPSPGSAPSAAPQGSYGAPGAYGAPDAHGPAGAYGAADAYQQDPYAPQTGPLPGSGPQPMGGPLPSSGPSRPRRRRGLWPLIIGLVLLLVIGPAATIGGIVWSVGSLAADASQGPVAMEGGSAEVEVSANEMLIVYVPQADAESAQCTAEGSTPGSVTTVPSSSSITFADGSEYVQTLGVAAIDDTTVTVSCTGTEEPAYLGPYSVFGMAAPLLIGPIVGLVSGLIGLVLTIIGIVLLVRSRRS